ncbi:MAG: hypothetical protein KTU85_08665 [Acidimicrobiia bacterium]|nr:hypothetical protein [Acidimicrobiia bacterium]
MPIPFSCNVPARPVGRPWPAPRLRLFAFSIVVFIFGVIVDFSDAVSRIVISGVIAGTVVLAPAIIARYDIKAAVRSEKWSLRVNVGGGWLLDATLDVCPSS